MEKLNRIRTLEPSSPTKATGIFKGEASGFLNWNDTLYPDFYEKYNLALANFWKASEVSMQQDKKQWAELDEEVQDVFLDISTMLAGLDSLQTPTMMDFMHYIKDPSVKAILAIFAQQEAVHNESYSYIEASLVPLEKQKKMFDRIKNHPEVLKRNQPILDAYEKFKKEPTAQNLFEAMVHSTNLEGIYFIAGFAFFYNLARQQLMMGTSSMISYIHRDEMVHYDFIGTLLRILMTEYPELNNEENIQYVYNAVGEAVYREKEWSSYMFEDISVSADIDLDELNDYIEYVANKRLRMLGLENLYPEKENIMPWIKTFDEAAMNETKSDQFEIKPRTYSKVGTDNGFDEL